MPPYVKGRKKALAATTTTDSGPSSTGGTPRADEAADAFTLSGDATASLTHSTSKLSLTSGAGGGGAGMTSASSFSQLAGSEVGAAGAGAPVAGAGAPAPVLDSLQSSEEYRVAGGSLHDRILNEALADLNITTSTYQSKVPPNARAIAITNLTMLMPGDKSKVRPWGSGGAPPLAAHGAHSPFPPSSHSSLPRARAKRFCWRTRT